MTTNVPKTPAEMPKDFAEAYAKALGNILRFEEDKANHGLNATFKLAGSFKPEGNIWTMIHEDLANSSTRGLLYGDYLSNSSYPWIKDPVVLATVARHATLLGEDEAVIEKFLKRTHATYGTRPEPDKLRLIA